MRSFDLFDFLLIAKLLFVSNIYGRVAPILLGLSQVRLVWPTFQGSAFILYIMSDRRCGLLAIPTGGEKLMARRVVEIGGVGEEASHFPLCMLILCT